MNMQKAVFNWSGGKDSAIALHHILKNKDYDVSFLLTSINQSLNRISMHGVRVELLEAQVKSLGIPLHKLELPEMPSMEDYNAIMHSTLNALTEKGVTHSIFGDIFLEDLRKYREEKVAQAGMTPVFPIWKRPTNVLLKEFIDLGFKAVLVCINDKFLDESFVGRIIDKQFVKDLPKDVDPCGENGEFHTFVYDGPIFSKPIDFTLGEKVYKEYKPCAKKENTKEDSSSYKGHDNVFANGFYYQDLLPKE